ncbi:MAG: MOSC domain-containing protein [Myxococcales bacterium]|nr:MOSC domain-containing protein [Myxococcales bacterium]
MSDQEPLFEALAGRFPQDGVVTWIGLRPVKRGPVKVVESVEAEPSVGLIGDHYSGSSGKRHVTLLDAAHLAVIGEHLGQPPVDPALLRRNLLIRGVNLLALKDRRFRIGDVELVYTGACHPCDKMELALGPGGWNAMRWHGGIHARVESRGTIRVGDALSLLD